MQVNASIDESDVGSIRPGQHVSFRVGAYPNESFSGSVEQLRLNPTVDQNVVTYTAVISAPNGKLKLKPGMTANLTITIDERNNVLKVPNAALRFTPQDTTAQRTGSGNSNGPGRRQSGANGSGNGRPEGAPRSGSGNDVQFAPPTAPVLAGQTRIIWVADQNGTSQRRRIKVGLSDGVSTEVVEGNLQEGEMVITGQTLSGAAKSTTPTNQSSAPGFGGASRTGGGGGGRRN